MATSHSGFSRLRNRAHRRRHKQKLPVDELSDLLEMKAAEEEAVQLPVTVEAHGHKVFTLFTPKVLESKEEKGVSYSALVESSMSPCALQNECHES